MCQGLPIALVQVKSGNTLKELLNEKMFQNVSKCFKNLSNHKESHGKSM